MTDHPTDTAALRDDLATRFNDAVVKITEAAILHLDADEDNTAQLQAFEQALLPILAALSEPSLGEMVDEAETAWNAFNGGFGNFDKQTFMAGYRAGIANTALSAEPADGLREARVKALEEAVLKVIETTRAYLPPDGISAQECISRIIGATDNPTISPIIAEIENGRS